MKATWKNDIEKTIANFATEFNSLEIFNQHNYREGSTPIYWGTFPFSEYYYTPIVRTFLYEISHKFNFNSSDFFIARDGLIDLVKFFIEFPTPKLKLTPIIPKIFESIVPMSWREKVLFYHIDVMKTDRILKNHCVIAVFNGGIFTEEYMLTKTEEIISKSSHLKKMNVMLELRNNLMYKNNYDNGDQILKQLLLTHEKLVKKFDLNLISYNSLKSNVIDSSYSFLDENNLLVYDWGIQQRMAVLGYHKFETNPLKFNQIVDYEIPISLNSKIQIFEANEKTKYLLGEILSDLEHILKIKNATKELNNKKFDNDDLFFTLQRWAPRIIEESIR